VAGFYDDGYEPLGSIKARNFLVDKITTIC
jgi:hypothetical protein